MRSLVGLLLLSLTVTSSALFDDEDDVVLLDETNFETEVLDSTDYWIVKFYAPWCGHCKKLAPEWKKAATQLKEIGRVGAIDCDENKDLAGKYGVSGFPTIKVFGDNKKEPEDYKSGRDVDSIVNFVKNGAKGSGSAPSQLIPIVKYVDMHSFLYNNKQAKVLFFPDEKGVPSWAKMMASSFKEGKKRSIMFAEVSPEDTKTWKAFGVLLEDAPVVLISIAGSFVEYGGDINKNDLKDELDQYVGMGTDVEIPEDWTKIPTLPERPTPKKIIPPASLNELNSDNFERKCIGSTCVVFLTKDTPDVNEEYSFIPQLTKKYRHDPLSFGWINGMVQKSFIQTLDIGADDLPSMVVIKSKKDGKRLRFARHSGDMTVESTSDFVDKILGGDAQFTKISELKVLADWELKMDEE